MNVAAGVTRAGVVAAVAGSGWQLITGALLTCVTCADLTQGVRIADLAVRASGDSDGHLQVDLRRSVVLLRLQTASAACVTEQDVATALAITAALEAAGHPPGSVVSTGQVVGDRSASRRTVQSVELAIDALEPAAVYPFWKAVLGYVDEPVGSQEHQWRALIDPAGQGPTLWFQQMDAPRPQRNRIHVDVIVDESAADARIAAALAAGGRMVSDARARAFWVLADVEGNEVCVCTWQDRD